VYADIDICRRLTSIASILFTLLERKGKEAHVHLLILFCESMAEKLGFHGRLVYTLHRISFTQKRGFESILSHLRETCLQSTSSRFTISCQNPTIGILTQGLVIFNYSRCCPSTPLSGKALMLPYLRRTMGANMTPQMSSRNQSLQLSRHWD
jgi:hypothetical protein